MDLSVVIVNYNVRHFLEQCLYSVFRANRHIESEIFVVDNNSVDGSSAMVREKFPKVKLIENKENFGFSKANNQALRLASGKYCLLLNPDTIVEEDTFVKCINFMESHPETGALGVKMIDGKGKFLLESKRSLPTPIVAFYKIFGLSTLFPKSKTFGRYHLSHLNSNETHPVDVIAGAFMFIQKKAISRVGLLDEDYFMYGEDIDLSYRLIKAGYKNYYFPETTIIHYKGESTKKSSINYVLIFYRAMIIFARKHFNPKNAQILIIFIQLAIYIRAFLSISKRLLSRLYQPFIDILLIFSGFSFIVPLWEKYKFGTIDYYPKEFFAYAVPVYISIWIITIYFAGGYEKPLRLRKIFTGHLVGTLIILSIYALLPENMRFSRALILFSSIWGMFIIFLHRLILYSIGFKDYELAINRKIRQVIVGLMDEAKRVAQMIRSTHLAPDIIGFVAPVGLKSSDYLGDTSQLSEIIMFHNIDEIVFCAANISSIEVINCMIRISDLPVSIKIAPPESHSIIGSHSVYTAGDLYDLNFNSIGKYRNRLLKRLFDLTASIIIIILLPFLFPFLKNFRLTLKDAIKVIFYGKTWVSYHPASNSSILPSLKSGIYNPSWDLNESGIEIIEKNNIEYASDYKPGNDLIILWRNIFHDSR